MTERTGKKDFVASIMEAAAKGSLSLDRSGDELDRHRHPGPAGLGRPRLGDPARRPAHGRPRPRLHREPRQRQLRREAEDRAGRVRVRDPLVGDLRGVHAEGRPRLPRWALRHRRRHPGAAHRGRQLLRHGHRRADPRRCAAGAAPCWPRARTHGGRPRGATSGPRSAASTASCPRPRARTASTSPAARTSTRPTSRGPSRSTARTSGRRSTAPRPARSRPSRRTSRGTAGAHTGNYTDQMVNSFSSTVDGAISAYQATQSSSSSGGGGGGGFSGGGGGGGGGGGSW